MRRRQDKRGDAFPLGGGASLVPCAGAAAIGGLAVAAAAAAVAAADDAVLKAYCRGRKSHGAVTAAAVRLWGLTPTGGGGN
jgi:hypothetical protein